MPAIKPGKPPMGGAIEPPSPETVRTTGEAAQGAAESARSQDGPVADAVIDAGRAQSLSLAVLDAAGHLRRVEALSLAAMARACEAILDGDIERGGAALAATEATLDKAIDRLARLVHLSASPPSAAAGSATDAD